MAPVPPERLRAALEPVVNGAGFDLETLSIQPVGRRLVVRVVVDRDGGTDLDAIASISRTVSDALDRDAVMGDAAYTLEVSSPGVDRPLTEPRHWRRAVGRLVTTAEFTGRVLAADDDGATLEVAGQQLTRSYPELGTGKVQVEFSPAGRP
jgi:ribosome maturation factor RimP